MLCKNQHSLTKNQKPPVSSGFRLPLHFTTSSIPPNPHLNHKLPQQKRKKKENMTILKSFPLPSSPSALQIPNEKERDSPPSNFFFIAFLASKDPLTNQPWCPDVRAALPILEATFQEPTTSQGADGGEGKKEQEEGKKSTPPPPPVVAFIEVGQKTEYVSSFFFPYVFCHLFLVFSPCSFSSFLGKQNRWKNPHNVFRTQWDIHNVPVLVRYELVAVAVEGHTTTTKQVKEVGRLVEGEILDERRLQELVYG